MDENNKEDYPLLENLNLAELQRSKSTRWHWYGHLFSIMLILLLAWTPYTQSFHGSVCIRDSESFYNGIQSFVEDEMRIVHPPTSHGWTGAPNAVNTKLWEDMSKVGTVALENDEYTSMELETAVEPSTGLRFIIPQVFHNLHCLKLFRDTIWQNDTTVIQANHGHIDHCIENLRYNTMCMADLSPITFYWNEAHNKHSAKYDLPRQCRKWEPIWDWASRNNLLDKLENTDGVAQDLEHLHGD